MPVRRWASDRIRPGASSDVAPLPNGFAVVHNGRNVAQSMSLGHGWEVGWIMMSIVVWAAAFVLVMVDRENGVL